MIPLFEETLLPQPDSSPEVLIEVPHAAWRRSHYEDLRALLHGPLPEELHAFFYVNTDVGAEALGLAVARGLAARGRSALLIASRIPRTFIDCNRLAEAPAGDLRHGGVTAGLAPYVEDPRDQQLLLELHRQYVAHVEAAFARVCGTGGLALLPHSYAPRTVGVDRIDAGIVPAMRAAWAPGTAETWPLRPSVDLITRTPEGEDLSIPGAAGELAAAYAELGLELKENQSYSLHPATQGARVARLYPGQTLCLELRRDHLVRQWRPFEEMEVDADAITRLSLPLVELLDRALGAP